MIWSCTIHQYKSWRLTGHLHASSTSDSLVACEPCHISFCLTGWHLQGQHYIKLRGTAQLIWKRPPLFGSPVLSKVNALKGLRCGRGHGCACQTRPNSTSQDCVYLLCLIWSSNCWYSTEVHWFCWYKCSPGRALRPNSVWKPDLSSRLTILLTFPHDILSFPFFHLSAGSGSALIDPSCFLLSPSPSFFLSLRKPDPISLWGSSHLQLNGARFSTQDASGLYSIHDLLEVISMILTGYIYDRHDT